MAHTPGDWQITQGSLGGTDVSCVEAESGVRMVVASVGGWNAEEVWANARLIAAAPNLLAALKQIAILDELSPSIGLDDYNLHVERELREKVRIAHVAIEAIKASPRAR